MVRVGVIVMKSVLIVDDSQRSLDMLREIVNNLPGDIMVYEASNLDDAYALAMKNNIDLFLLDVILDSSNLVDVSGIHFANNMRDTKKYQYTPIIFITSLEDPKLYAYSELHCYSYIEKPYDVQKASKIILEALEIPQAKKEKKNVFFRKDGILYKKDASEVLYIENSRTGQVVHFVNGDLNLSYQPTKNILAELACDCFVQCSRYVIVNKDFIDNIDITNRYITLTNGKKIEIGMAFKNIFLRDFTDD